MGYTRPKPLRKVAPEEKSKVIDDYLAFYSQAAASDPTLLNRKLPRSVLKPILEEVGQLLVERASQIAGGSHPSSEQVMFFLGENDLPESMREILTDELRAFALLINGMKQWVNAESAATDRWVISGNARKILRERVSTCPITGNDLEETAVELHHTVRDGRPPIPLSKEGHEAVESSAITDLDSPIGSRLVELRKTKRGRYSWKALWHGCCIHMGLSFEFESKNRASFCRSLANYYQRESGYSFEQMRDWIETQELVEPDELDS